MFSNFSNKIKNLFKSRKRNTVSTKDLFKITNNLQNIQKYKNLIPNLLDEFEIENTKNIKRSNSFTIKNKKLSLSEHKLTHLKTGSLFKIRRHFNKKPNKSPLDNILEKSNKDSKHKTTKNVRRGSFREHQEIKEEDNSVDLQAKNIESNDNRKKRKLKRKRTMDPQETNKVKQIKFDITGEKDELGINNTNEKIEEYQEKMRKTQLRYYVFKKITNYKSTLRRFFQRYRNTVQLMEAIDEKKEDIKEINLENEKMKAKVLKNIIKNRAFKEQKELNKYFLRFYYNSKYARSISNLKNNMDNNENNNNNNNLLNTLKNEIKKEEEKKEPTPEELEMIKRKKNKELRDLFYNKVRERKKWLHDHFVRFYYKGLLWAMKTGNIKNNTSSSGETENTNTNNDTNVNANANANANTNVNNNENQTNNNSNNSNINNNTSSEIDTININKEIEKKEEEQKKEEPKKEEKKGKKISANKLRDRSKGLRKLLSERNKEKTNTLRKYFFKFLSNGILLSLKKTTIQSTKTLTNFNDIQENTANEEEKKKEEEEKNWIIEEKKRRKLEEEQKQKELWEKKIKMILKIFNKKDQIQCGRERSCLQKWNLRAKIIAISDLTVGFRKSKKSKGKKKNKKKDDKNTKDNEKEQQ